MSRIRWTPAAIDQLTRIVEHIRQDNAEAARRVAHSVLDSIKKLETFPGLGRTGQKQGTRELVVSPYVIVYRVKEDTAEILFIWHGAQDWH